MLGVWGGGCDLQMEAKLWKGRGCGLLEGGGGVMGGELNTLLN